MDVVSDSPEIVSAMMGHTRTAITQDLRARFGRDAALGRRRALPDARSRSQPYRKGYPALGSWHTWADAADRFRFTPAAAIDDEAHCNGATSALSC
jgi:hypothetical protein